MHRINGNDITLTRGDTLILQIEISKGDEVYTPVEGDYIRFAMKHKYSDADSAVKILKEIPTDTMTLELLPEDTKSLSMGKKYVYDMELTDNNGRVYTFISGTLRLTEEVL